MAESSAMKDMAEAEAADPAAAGRPVLAAVTVAGMSRRCCRGNSWSGSVASKLANDTVVAVVILLVVRRSPWQKRYDIFQVQRNSTAQ